MRPPASAILLILGSFILVLRLSFEVPVRRGVHSSESGELGILVKSKTPLPDSDIISKSKGDTNEVLQEDLRIMSIDKEYLNRTGDRLQESEAQKPPKMRVFKNRGGLDYTNLTFEDGLVYNRSMKPQAFDNQTLLKDGFDLSPVVLEKFRLIFFTIPKVACTEFKRLFRRMEGYDNWKVISTRDGLPHAPKANGLRYMSDYTPAEATLMMHDPTWMKAVFLRDPLERALSAYIDKVTRFAYYRKTCEKNKSNPAFDEFLRIIRWCKDPHWTPQYDRIDSVWWPFVNYYGRFNHLYDDTKRMLTEVGAWRDFGENGWGKEGNHSIFAPGSNNGNFFSTKSKERFTSYVNFEVIRDAKETYRTDYQNLGNHFNDLDSTALLTQPGGDGWGVSPKP
ncbi:hypothetical protein AAMO2058_001296400 [Amorphochlora amoebiformis]